MVVPGYLQAGGAPVKFAECRSEPAWTMTWWLMKSEPDVYGIHHLEVEGSTLWDGIRN
jgi:hypothetical protein